MAEIFISYKSERRNAAKHLAGVLTRYGYSVWFDYGLIKGDDFDFQLDRQLRDAKAVIVLWCSMSVESAWVSREASLAAKLKTLLPVLIEDCELKLAYRTADYVDLIRWDGSPRSYMLDPLLRGVTRLVRRDPQANFAELSKYEEDWRMFGSPTLAAFALGKAVEPTVQGAEWGLTALAAREWPSVRDSNDVSKLQRFEKHFAGTWYADEARELHRTLETAKKQQAPLPASAGVSRSEGEPGVAAVALTSPPSPTQHASTATGQSRVEPADSPLGELRPWGIATICLAVILCASVVPNLALFFLGDGTGNVAAYPLATSAIATVLQILAAFLLVSQVVQPMAHRIALTLSFILGWFLALPVSLAVKFMTDQLQKYTSALGFSDSKLMSTFQALEPAPVMSLVCTIAVLSYLRNLSWSRSFAVVAFFPVLMIVRYFILVLANTFSSSGVTAFLVIASSLLLPMLGGLLFCRRWANASIRRYLVTCLIGLPVWCVLSVLVFVIAAHGKRQFLSDESCWIFPLFIFPILIAWVGLRGEKVDLTRLRRGR